MTDYTKTTNFLVKDALVSGDTNKIIRGSEIDYEFDQIAVHSATKADVAGDTFTGDITAPNVTVTGTLTAGTIDGGSY